MQTTHTPVHRLAQLLCLTGMVILFMKPVSAQPGEFTLGTSIPVMYNPSTIVCADFNGDDYPDIAAGINNEYTNNPLGIFLNNGAGSISTIADSLYTNAEPPAGIAAGDLNGDNIIDLAVTLYVNSLLQIYLGNGDGTFTLDTTITVPSLPGRIVIADFNNDSDNDIAIVSKYSFLHVYSGNNDGTFSLPASVSTGGSSEGIDVYDVNKDNFPDILVGNGNMSSFSLFLNSGYGSFPAKTNINTYRPPWFVVAGNFDGDTIPDIATGSGSYQEKTSTIMLGDGQGNFAPSCTLNVCSNVRDLVVDDFNNDGRDEIVLGDPYGLYLIWTEGNGLFASVDTIDQGDFYRSRFTLTADINKDGKNDIIVGRDGEISIYYNGPFTAIKNEESKMMFFELFQNYPNPFNPSTTITYQIPENGHVKLDVFNVLGQRVKTLVNDFRNAGIYTVEFDGIGLCSGTYFYKLKAGRFFQMRKMVYMR